jgi:hypothetical protein
MVASGMKPVPGICDRCGLRYPLKKLKYEFLLGRSTGLRVCTKCLDPSHPQLDTRGVRTDDKQSVVDSRTDAAELAASRAMFAWNPVGTPLTSTAEPQIGKVTVIITED